MASIHTKLTSPIGYRETRAELKCGLKAELYVHRAWGRIRNPGCYIARWQLRIG